MKPLTKRLLAVYILWVMLHFIFLVAGDNFFGYTDINRYLGITRDDFWPFDANMHDYDITEFFVYSLLPVSLYWAIRLIKESLPSNEQCPPKQ